MAQRKKRVTTRKSTVPVGRASPLSQSRGKAAKQPATKLSSKKGLAKAKRAKAKKVSRKKARPMKQPVTPVAETTTVDVVEEPGPAVTEFEETDVREADAGREPQEES